MFVGTIKSTLNTETNEFLTVLSDLLEYSSTVDQEPRYNLRGGRSGAGRTQRRALLPAPAPGPGQSEQCRILLLFLWA